MTRFKAPYGTADQHVIGPVHHLGYRYLVAYCVDLGWRSERIVEECWAAHEARAPKDTVCRQGDQWVQLTDITNLATMRRYRGYAAALNQHEQRLVQARQT